jgi:hypothetical protein
LIGLLLRVGTAGSAALYTTRVGVDRNRVQVIIRLVN